MTFRLTTLLYLFALVASSMAVVGAWGLLLGGWIFFVWAWVSHPLRYPTSAEKFWAMVKLLACPLILVALLVPAMQPAREPPHGRTRNNLANLSQAIRTYYEEHGRYPPPYVTDSSGTPLYSWRVLLLPYLEQQPIAAQFHYDESWDSPHNLQWLVNIGVLQSHTQTVPGETNFLAVVGEGTIWDPNRKISEEDITDYRGETLLLLEVPSLGVRWSEPRDLSRDEAIDLLQKSTGGGQWSTPKNHILFANGTVRRFPKGLSASDAAAILTHSGGEPVEALARRLSWWENRRNPVERLWSAAILVGIALLPLCSRLSIFPTNPR